MPSSMSSRDLPSSSCLSVICLRASSKVYWTGNETNECDATLKNNVAATFVKAYNKQRFASLTLKEITSCIRQPVIDGIFGDYTMLIK